jgi:hypothetical protein
MPQVVGVHGIGQQQLGAKQLLKDWAPALGDGIDAALGHNPTRPEVNFKLGFYGKLFLPEIAARDSTDKDIKKSGAAVADDLDPAEVEWFDDVADEVVAPPIGAPEDLAAGTPADPEWVAKAIRLPGPSARLAAWLDNQFGAAGSLLFFSDLRQVQRYQRDEGIADAARARVLDAAGDGCTVLIGHSLGSVVAYEVACLTPPKGLRLLVTLGSPLGLATVRRRLRHSGPPDDIAWVNVVDPKDPVCCAGGVKPHWPAAHDRLVHNGDQPHSATRYLGKGQTGEAVARALGW